MFIFICLYLFFNSEHDDRDREVTTRPTDITIRKTNKNDKRRVSFKNANFGTGNANSVQLKLRKKFVEQGLRSQLDEDDERMVDFAPHKSSTFRRRNSPIPGSARNNKAKGLVENGAGWYQVTVCIDNINHFTTHCISVYECGVLIEIIYFYSIYSK